MKKPLIILLLCIVSLSLQAQDRPFITEWKIEEDNYKLELQISEDYQLSDYDMTIDWGDGTKDHNTFKHLYPKAGIYQVKISGKYPGIIVGKIEDDELMEETIPAQPYFVTVLSWGNNRWKSMYNMFAGCTNFQEIKAKDMFKGAVSFDQPLNDWDVSKVKNNIRFGCRPENLPKLWKKK